MNRLMFKLNDSIEKEEIVDKKYLINRENKLI